jgi:bisphosphoglycerate-dependent phosphoglycerate mutase
MNRFYDAYPEYEARSALWDTPQERLTQFLRTNIWETWGSLGSVEREQIAAQLGDQFQTYFLDKTSRNYDLINNETLAYWAKVMGALVPETATPVQPEGTNQLPTVPPEIAATVDAYRMLRKSLYPNYYALQQRYYSLPAGQERKDFLEKFPQLKEYFDWNKEYKKAHPEVAEYADTYQPPQYDYSFLQQFTTPLTKQLYAYFLNETPLSSGAIEELSRIYNDSGNQGGSFNAFIEAVIRPLFSP